MGLHTRLRTSICLITLIAVLLPTWPRLGQAPDPDKAPARVLDGERVRFTDGLLVLDHQLAEHREWVVEVLEDELKKARAAPPFDAEAIEKQSKRLVDQWMSLLGQPTGGPLYEQMLAKAADSMEKVESPVFIPAEQMLVFVIKQETALDYLAAGGELPFTSYIPATRQLRFNVDFSFTHHNVQLPVMLFLEDLRGHDKGEFRPELLRRMIRSIYLHKKQEGKLFNSDQAPANGKAGRRGVSDNSMWVATSKLLRPFIEQTTRLNQDEHNGWFINGLSTAAAERTLLRLGEEDAAAMLRQTIEKNPDNGDPTKTLLRYWPIDLTIELQNSYVAVAKRQSRNTASHREMRALLDHLGDKRLPELVELIQDEAINTTAKLEAAVNQRFDYDISARLDLYQPEGTPEQLYAQSIELYKEYRDKDLLGDAFNHLIVAHELQAGSSLKDNPRLYNVLCKMLSRTKGERRAAAQACYAWWKVLHRQPEAPTTRQRLDVAMLWLVNAMAFQQPSLAYKLIEALDRQPFAPTFGSDEAGHAQAINALADLVRASQLIDQLERDAAIEKIDQALAGFPTSQDSKKMRRSLLLPNAKALRDRIEEQWPGPPPAPR